MLGALMVSMGGIVGCSTTTKSQAGSAPECTGNLETVPFPQLSEVEICRGTLHQIQGAKAMWALENRKTGTDLCTDVDVFGPDAYMDVKPNCPTGGVYTLGLVESNATCSIVGHEY